MYGIALAVNDLEPRNMHPVLVQSQSMALREGTGQFTESHPQCLDRFICGVYPCTTPP